MAEKKEKKGVGWAVVWCLFLGGWILFHRVVHWGNWEWLIGFGGFLVWIGLSFPVIWKVLAPRNFFFTLVEEGHVKTVMKGDAFHKILMAWKDYKINENTWEISKIEPPERAKKKFWGGIFLYGIPPFHKIYKYHQRWTNLLDSGEIKSYDEDLEATRLKTEIYAFEFPLDKKGGSAEDINGVPIGFTLVVPIKMVNPYEALFVYGRWLGMIHGAIKPIARRFVARYRFKEDLIDMRAGGGIGDIQIKKGITRIEDTVDKDTGEKVKKIVSETKEGEDLRDKLWLEIAKTLIPEADFPEDEEEIMRKEEIRVYGVALVKKGVDIIDIDPDPAYRELTTAEYKAKREAEVITITAQAEAEAEKIRGEGIADGTSERTTGAVVKALAGMYGKDKETICKEIAAGQYKEEIPKLYDEVRSREGMDAGAYGELKLPASVEGTILGLVSGVASKLINPTRSSAGGGGKKKTTAKSESSRKERLLKGLEEL